MDLPICVHSRWRGAPSRGAGKVQFEHSGDNEIEKLNEHLSDSQTQESHVASGTARGRFLPFIVVATATTTTTTTSTTTTGVEKRYGTQLKFYSIKFIEIECLSDHLGTLNNKYL